MIIGASDKFNFRELAATLSSAGIAAEINLTHFFSQTNIVAQAGQNTVNAVATAGVNKIVYHQQPNTEDIAAQALGTTIGTAGGEVIGEKLDVERRRLGIYTEAEIMATKREQEEKAVWRYEQQEELRSEQHKQQQASTAKTLRMMRAKQQAAHSNFSDSSDYEQTNTEFNDLFDSLNRTPSPQLVMKSSNLGSVRNKNDSPFMSSDSNVSGGNGTNEITLSRIANSRIVSAINTIGDKLGNAIVERANGSVWDKASDLLTLLNPEMALEKAGAMIAAIRAESVGSKIGLFSGKEIPRSLASLNPNRSYNDFFSELENEKPEAVALFIREANLIYSEEKISE